ncbi:HAD-IA family hydrolase [Methylomonas sp. Kb3]|uniref:HAD family hydrolase n=1 Tax=Methylomonas sp. Kb3 TaxID=1611544 RepID=UPI0013FE1D52|nr:HAD-IA family hydrolase [Methylomonas sp. Kb3]
MNIKAVIFDCDGTLVDSEVLANQVLVEYAREYGLNMPVNEAIELYTGCKMADCIADLEYRLGRKLPDHFVTTLRERTLKAFESRLKPVEGALNLIKNMRLPYFVASSGPRVKIENSLRITGLLPYFSSSQIFSSYEIGHWKPDPRIYLEVAREIKVEPSLCSVVEDSLPGIKAGIGAGMKTFAFGNASRLTEELSQAIAIGHLSELESLFTQGDAKF